MPKKLLPIHKAFAKKIKSLWKRNQFGTSLIGNPIKTFKQLKKGAKMSQRNKHKATRVALGKALHARLLNGPELNILLLGIPFLIDFGVAYGKGRFLRPGAKLRNRGHETPPIEVQVQETPVDHSGDLGENPPLEPSAFSEQALILYNALIQAGMSEEGARMMASGELEGQEVSDYLSEDDVQALTDAFGTALELKKDQKLSDQQVNRQLFHDLNIGF